MPTHEHRWRHLALLISILVLFTLSPFVVTFRHAVLILNIIGATVLVAGSYALSERKHQFTIAIVLSAISNHRDGVAAGFWATLGCSRFPYMHHRSGRFLFGEHSRLRLAQRQSYGRQNLCRGLRLYAHRIRLDVCLRTS